MSINTDLFGPALGLFLLTFLVLFRLGLIRLMRTMKGVATLDQFKGSAAEALPSLDSGSITNRNLINLCETPVLFYAIIAIISAYQLVDQAYVCLAWTYVLMRGLHTIVHLTFNNVPVRFAFFLLSMITLLVMWIRLGMTVA